MKILQIPYYPIRHPISGGQRRTANLRGLLSDLGHRVTTMAISPHRGDGEAEEDDIVLSLEQHAWVFRVPHHFELRLAQAASFSEPLCRRIEGAFRREDPDLVWLEHPFLWSLLEDYIAAEALPVIYSSHNVEWKMKQELLAVTRIFDPLAVHEIKDLEEDLARRAQAIVCCSEDDGSYYRSLSARTVMVIPNGADVPSVADEAGAFHSIRSYCSDAFAVPTFCYVSSYHEPNWQGFVELVLEPLSSREPVDPMVILLIGGIGRFYRSRRGGQTLPEGIKVATITDASEDVKNLSLLKSDAVLLPIRVGGGTNLKTAEALLSGKAIIATSRAFRGFEEYMRHDLVSIADGAEAFRDAMEQAAQRRCDRRTSISAHDLMTRKRQPEDLDIRDRVSWKGVRRRAAPILADCLKTIAG